MFAKSKEILYHHQFFYKNRKTFPIYISEKTFKRHVDLLLIQEEGKSQYLLVKYLNTSMYNETLHHDRKQSCLYCLHSFTNAKLLEIHVHDCFKINGKQILAKKMILLNLKTIPKK